MLRSNGITYSTSWPDLFRPSTPSLLLVNKKDVDARDKRGHDDGMVFRSYGHAPKKFGWRVAHRSRRHDTRAFHIRNLGLRACRSRSVRAGAQPAGRAVGR